jgi:hypothetical protein
MRPEIEHGAGIETREEIEALVAYEGRGAGTDAERRAAEHLARRLRAIGREGEVEPVVDARASRSPTRFTPWWR